MTKRQKPTKTPGNERAREQQAAAKSKPADEAWRAVRGCYAPDVRKRVEAVMQTGGVSLSLIEALELAEHERLLDEIEDCRDMPGAGACMARFYHLRLQHRKHMRTLRLAMTPLSSPGDMAHPTPAIIAALTARDDDGEDFGDELMS